MSRRNLEQGTKDSSILTGLVDAQDTWDIEELDNTKSLTIPDSTIIIFMPCSLIDRLENCTWSSFGTGIKLPTIVLKDPKKESLSDITAKMKCAFMDFKFLHKKPHKAYIPFSSSHLISMPFVPRGYNC